MKHRNLPPRRDARRTPTAALAAALALIPAVPAVPAVAAVQAIPAVHVVAAAPAAAVASVPAGPAAAARAAADDTVAMTRDEALEALLERAFPDGPAPAHADGRELFAAALASEAFERAAVGPWDVYVLAADELKQAKQARKLLAAAVEGLEPAAGLVAGRFGREDGAISGRRFPLVLVGSQRDDGQTGYDEVLALLDRCEDLGYSGWKPDLPLWTDAAREARSAMTWEVLVVNTEHPDVASSRSKEWLEHGLGYEALNHLVNRAFAVGTWGPAPPWLAQGLADELDIEAYGEAWVAAGESTSWSSQTAGWKRQGWSGFLPEGQQPPPPVYGPPPNLPSRMETMVSSDDVWLDRRDSGVRHWSVLAGDRESDVPASLASAAAAQDYKPRDRAYARCVLHLLLQLAPPEGASLLELLDRRSTVTETGMRDAEPLPVVFARALGGLPEVDALEALAMQAQLLAIGRQDLVDRIRRLGGEGMLAVADHREQARWLYRQQDVDDETRLALYTAIVEVEALQQLREWELLGHALDAAADAALTTTPSYPKQAARQAAVAEAFRAALSP
jgi:hypothetical protein